MCFSTRCAHLLRHKRSKSGPKAYLESTTVLYEQLLGKQPCPCHVVADIAALRIDCIQGRLASSLFPYLSPCQMSQSLRVLPSADTRYSRDEAEEQRIDTGMLASHFGLGIGSLGDSVSLAVTSVRTSMLKTAAFPMTVVILVLCCVWGMSCPLRFRGETGSRSRCQHLRHQGKCAEEARDQACTNR